MKEEIERLALRCGHALRDRGWRLATAESCTGGWVAKCVTDIAGSSTWFDRGFVTYSNAAKREMLGVREDTLEGHGAVSEQTVGEMAAGALGRSLANVALAVSGIAGPDGGTADKPVGTVWFAWKTQAAAAVTERRYFIGDRDAVRRQAVRVALEGVLAIVR
ncbi:MAG: nicotinamide-nucleotide amidase [Gammaproteobacteria bacterium]|nr:nicotinamide-nucleotide amidase [Gammaproteobacteria bacterium]